MSQCVAMQYSCTIVLHIECQTTYISLSAMPNYIYITLCKTILSQLLAQRRLPFCTKPSILIIIDVHKKFTSIPRSVVFILYKLKISMVTFSNTNHFHEITNLKAFYLLCKLPASQNCGLIFFQQPLFNYGLYSICRIHNYSIEIPNHHVAA